MKERLQAIKDETITKIENAGDMNVLNEIRVEILGKKGKLTEVLKGMKDVDPQDRPKVGQMVNDTRKAIEEKMEEVKNRLEEKAREAKLKEEVIDVTLPAKKNKVGHKHPNTLALEELERIFVGMGYEVVEGPEVEFAYYNFEALNIPEDVYKRQVSIQDVHHKINLSLRMKIQKIQYGGHQMNIKMITIRHHRKLGKHVKS